MSLVEEDCNDKLDDLTKHQLDTLGEWETKFQEKYEVVGKVNFTLPESAPCVMHGSPCIYLRLTAYASKHIHDIKAVRRDVHAHVHTLLGC